MRARSERLPRIALMIASMPRPPTTSAATIDPATEDWSDQTRIATAKTARKVPKSRSMIRRDGDLLVRLEGSLLMTPNV